MFKIQIFQWLQVIKKFTVIYEFFFKTPKSRSKLRGGSRTAATCKVELFVIIVNGWKPVTIITKSSTLDVAAVLAPLLVTFGLSKLSCLKKIKKNSSSEKRETDITGDKQL